MTRIDRVAQALLRLVAVTVIATATATPARAVATSAELGSTVFAFDFSGSIYCYADGKPDASCSNPINNDLAQAVDALANDIERGASKYAERAIDFSVARFGSRSAGLQVVITGGQRCESNTKTDTPLLVSCLREVATLYRSPKYELGGTAFVPPLQYLDKITNQRCGLILFTDGTPDDQSKAKELAVSTNCAVLPVATGTGDIDQDYLHSITGTDIPPVEGCSEQKFEWPEVYFTTPEDAAVAIGIALDKVACVNPVPSPKCQNVAEYQHTLENLGFAVKVGSGVTPDQFPSTITPVPGSKEVAGTAVNIAGGSSTAPAQCTQTAPPTEPPPPPPLALPCVVDGPLSWFGCNTWVLFVLLGLVIARLLWIGRDLQVSINGQEAVALRGGTKVGFDIQNGTAARTPNPDRGQIKVTRSFLRFFPGTRIDASGLPDSSVGKGTKFNLGQEVALTSVISARIKYGNPRRARYSGSSDDTPTDFSSGSNPSGSSSAL
jgi:hypothetical protein